MFFLLRKGLYYLLIFSVVIYIAAVFGIVEVTPGLSEGGEVTPSSMLNGAKNWVVGVLKDGLDGVWSALDGAMQVVRDWLESIKTKVAGILGE